jgi:hypothetical protein
MTSLFSRLAPAVALCLAAALAACNESAGPEQGSSTSNATDGSASSVSSSTQQVSVFGSADSSRLGFEGDAQVTVDQIALEAGQRLSITDGQGTRLLDVGSEANGQRPALTARGGSVQFDLSAGGGGYSATVTTNSAGGGVDQATCAQLCGLGIQLTQCPPCP